MFRRFLSSILLGIALLAAVGCGSPKMMKTPHIYLDGDREYFNAIDPSLQTNYAEVIFATDRYPNNEGSHLPISFGHERSGHLRVGTCRVNFGENMTWDQIVDISTGGKTRPYLKIGEPDILMRYPGTWWHARRIDDPSDDFAEFEHRRMETRAKLHELLAKRLEVSKKKEVMIYVHGYNNSFDYAVGVTGNLWHYLGRELVPITYTWPAGAKGLRGYTTDRESGEFTIFHLKMFLEDVASCPEVEKINILAHSRGTDVTMTALRELVIKIRATGQDPRQVLKLANVVLASPDLDAEVTGQRISSEQIPDAMERLTIYLSPADKALKVSSWLQGSFNRLGLFDVSLLSPEDLQVLTHYKNMTMIDSRVTTGFFGHSYYYDNPAVSSDLIMLMRDDLPPGIEYGRPLEKLSTNLYRITDQYPFEDVNVFEKMTNTVTGKRPGIKGRREARQAERQEKDEEEEVKP